MSPARIRLANLADGPALLVLLDAVYQPSPWSAEQIEQELKSPQTKIWLTEDEQDLLGALFVQETLYEDEITQIVVLPSQRQRGLGSLLLGQLNLEKDIFLEVRASNQAAQALYRKFGFEEIGRRKNYYRAPLEDALMMKRERNEG